MLRWPQTCKHCYLRSYQRRWCGCGRRSYLVHQRPHEKEDEHRPHHGCRCTAHVCCKRLQVNVAQSAMCFCRICSCDQDVGSTDVDAAASFMPEGHAQADCADPSHTVLTQSCLLTGVSASRANVQRGSQHGVLWCQVPLQQQRAMMITLINHPACGAVDRWEHGLPPFIWWCGSLACFRHLAKLHIFTVVDQASSSIGHAQ